MSSQLCWEVVPTPRQDKTEPTLRQAPTVAQSVQTAPQTAPQHKSAGFTKSDLMFIKDLSPTDKSKIALMIQQLVKLEQGYLNLTDEHEKLKSKFEMKSELCNDMEEILDQMTAENEKLKSEDRAKAEVLSRYSIKLEETNNLLRLSSSTNKKLQRKLDVKKCHVQVQTEESTCFYSTKSLQTSFQEKEPAPEEGDPHLKDSPDPRFKDSMSHFLDKLDTLCDKLSTIDRQPAPEPDYTLVHNHKTDGRLVRPTPDQVYVAEEQGIEPANIRDSIILVREKEERRGLVSRYDSKDEERPGSRYDNKEEERRGSRYDSKEEERRGLRYDTSLLSLIEEIEQDEMQPQDDNDILSELYFKS